MDVQRENSIYLFPFNSPLEKLLFQFNNAGGMDEAADDCAIDGDG